MPWLKEYQLFLFDLDGLLVNTEQLHYRAYQQMLQARGYLLSWDFPRYCRAAHYTAEGLRDEIYAEFPKLYQEEPNWEILYEEKKSALKVIFQQGNIELMPGVGPLLRKLEEKNIARCVVSHSSGEQIALIRKQNPLLDTIPHWWTREHYTQPKPDPECYQKAILQLASPHDKVIGFEDTPRGVKALMGTRAQPVLVTTVPYPEVPSLKKQGVFHISSFFNNLL